ncbi:MAG: transporter substrate-binding domain-containing protein [Trueperaceae bacterium]|nr:transporter substrate-binding domain-containing protein [Trueperaceae bacterium]
MITAGGETDYAPYESYDEDGDPAGFNVDLLRAIGREVGFALGPWQEQRERLQAGEVDVLGMFVSEARRIRVDFAEPNVIVSHRIFVPAGREAVEGLEDLAGRSVVVQRGAYSHERLVATNLELELILVDDERTGLLRLVREGHDAALLTEHRARRVLEDEGLNGEVVSGPPVLPTKYAFAVRPGGDALLARIDEGLARVKGQRRVRPHLRTLVDAPRGGLRAASNVARGWWRARVGPVGRRLVGMAGASTPPRRPDRAQRV